MSDQWIGIDFGARLSGKTVVVSKQENGLQIDRVLAGQDADRFLIDTVDWLRPTHIYMDAPLSLPTNYQVLKPAGEWFYREADRTLGAMSPLFLGGLTARAMRLRALWAEAGIEVRETWPRGLVRELDLPGYKKKGKDSLVEFVAAMQASGFPEPAPQPADWHEADALLAWWSGWRDRQGDAREVGDPAEGVIVL